MPWYSERFTAKQFDNWRNENKTKNFQENQNPFFRRISRKIWVFSKCVNIEGKKYPFKSSTDRREIGHKQIKLSLWQSLQATLFCYCRCCCSFLLRIDDLWKHSFCDLFGISIENKNAIVINWGVGRSSQKPHFDKLSWSICPCWIVKRLNRTCTKLITITFFFFFDCTSSQKSEQSFVFVW